MIYKSILETVGDTPVVELTRLGGPLHLDVGGGHQHLEGLLEGLLLGGARLGVGDDQEWIGGVGHWGRRTSRARAAGSGPVSG